MDFAYQIANMDVTKDNDTVIRLHYRVTAHQDGCNLIPVSSGVVELNQPDPDNFIDFDNITQDIALSWLKSKIDCSSIEASLEQQINEYTPETNQASSSKLPASW